MRLKLKVYILVIFWLAGFTGLGRAAEESPIRLDDVRLPAAFLPVLKEHAPGLVGIQLDQGQVFSAEKGAASQHLRQSRIHLDAINVALGRNDPDGPFKIVLISDPVIWERCQKLFPGQERIRSAMVGEWIFLFRQEGKAGDVSDLAHELVHLRMGQLFPRRPPLWLEEGLSLYLSREAAREYFHFQGLRVVVPPEKNVEEWPRTGIQISSLDAYPSSPGEIRAYYEQVRQLAQIFCENIPRHERSAFIDKLIEGGDAYRMLREHQEIPADVLSRFQDLMELRQWKETENARP